MCNSFLRKKNNINIPFFRKILHCQMTSKMVTFQVQIVGITGFANPIKMFYF